MPLARLIGSVKHYAWGGYSFIPSLLKMENEAKKPFAEYWMGVHPQANCKVVLANCEERLLTELINDDPARLLGSYVHEHFNELPYLLKALDVKDMLSIQVHPSKAEAKRQFEKENAEGVPLDAAHRNYKDDNHKPELMVAMGDFWLLHGFKPPKELEYILLNVKELRSLLPVYNQSGYAGLYRYVMEMPQEEVNSILQPLLDNIVPCYQRNELSKEDEDFWASRAALTFNRGNDIDRGIFSVYLFNLVHLKRAQAIFQDAGVPHAYLEGQNIEIMASSDNVLRGGLTPKHIDVPELLKHVKCEPTYPDILQGKKYADELKYKTPAPDFELGCFSLKAGEDAQFKAATAEILLLTSGEVIAEGADDKVELKPGEPSAIAFAGESIRLRAVQDSLIFKAAVPIHNRE